MSYRCPNCSRTDFFTAKGFSKHKAKCLRKGRGTSKGAAASRPPGAATHLFDKKGKMYRPDGGEAYREPVEKASEGGNGGLRKRAAAIFLHMYKDQGLKVSGVHREVDGGVAYWVVRSGSLERGFREDEVVYSFKHGIPAAVRLHYNNLDG